VARPAALGDVLAGLSVLCAAVVEEVVEEVVW
jgi:hypothetical protein